MSYIFSLLTLLVSLIYLLEFFTKFCCVEFLTLALNLWYHQFSATDGGRTFMTPVLPVRIAIYWFPYFFIGFNSSSSTTTHIIVLKDKSLEIVCCQLYLSERFYWEMLSYPSPVFHHHST